MKIESITLSGFRCFDSNSETVHLGSFNCFIGPNASGKTAAMIALGRLFGESGAQRQITPADFHLAPGEKMNDRSPRNLFIDCRIEFPELDGTETADHNAIPEAFNQMIVDGPGATPYCRIRLEATWTDDRTLYGDVDQSLWWINANSDDQPDQENENRRKVRAGERSLIRLVYIPAARDPSQQIRNTTATSFGRLLSALSWNGSEASIKSKLTSLQDALSDLSAIKTINAEVQNDWKNLYSGRVAREVSFRALEEDPASLLNLLSPTFQPGENGHRIETRDLSDGLRSLFSLALSLGLFRVEELLNSRAEELGFKIEITEKIPYLTVFAVEEPENHLSPHYLGRVMSQLIDVSKSDRSQVILSSHCPSILARVEPDYVRYFLGNEQTCATKVKSLSLPQNEDEEAFKYVREAVRGFPELYFSRLVVLAEGPSEEIVLRRLFDASGTPLDTHFISIVPLGGRHVNHFWRLLHELDISFLTLLDLDREKEGGGWGRIQYLRNQLLKRFGAGSDQLKFQTDDGDVDLSDEAYENIATRPVTDIAWIERCLISLRDKFNIFFSAPLDLDFSMLEAFPEIYKSLAPTGGGPRLPAQESPDYSQTIERRMKQVLAADISEAAPHLGSTYTQEQRPLFTWYKYLFLDGSKPVAHMRALLKISDEELITKAPAALTQLVRKARQLAQAEQQ